VAVPLAPTGLALTKPNRTTVALTWNASTGATGYNIYRSSSKMSTRIKLNATPVTTRSYTNTGLVGGVTYYFDVTAVNADGQSPPSTKVSTTIATTTTTSTPAALTLSVTPSTAQVGNPVTAVSAVLNSLGTPIPNIGVWVELDGILTTPVGSPAAFTNSQGTATFIFPNLAVNTHTIIAVYVPTNIRSPTRSVIITSGTTGTGTKDINGMLYPQPFAGVTLGYFNESHGEQSSSNPTGYEANFRDDGHRYDFMGKRDSVLIAGYFYIPSYWDNDEISGKLNGGPHISGTDAERILADTMDMGICDLDGTESRIRFEAHHNDYSDDQFPTNINIGPRYGKWSGAVSMKVNLPDGTIGLVGMIDVGGLDGGGKPVNNWVTTFKRILTEAQIKAIDCTGPAGMNHIKSVRTPYVCTVGKCDQAQNTIRIDQEPPTGLLDKFVTCKEIRIL
jgi:hypothetical protein